MRESAHLPPTFTEWHRARKLRLEIENLAINDQLVSPDALERLNFGLSADGGWNCGLLPHFECERVLTRVLARGGLESIGPTSGGRWPAAAKLENLLGDTRRQIDKPSAPQDQLT